MLRTALLGILLLGLSGSLAELLLLGHYEEWRQMIPPGLLTASLLGLGVFRFTRSGAVLRSLPGLFGVFIIAGIAGIIFHVQGNAQFEVEMFPALNGLDLLWEALRGAFPALAPGTMIQLGLLGLLYSYRHPALARPGSSRRDNDDLGENAP